MNLTAQQKLVRLAEIEREIEELESQPAAHAADVAPLLTERDEILAGVQLPPRELGGLNDPEAWAVAMSATFAGLAHTTALAWMLGAMQAAFDNGRAIGAGQGREEVRQQRQESRTALVDALVLVLDLIDRRQIRPPMVRDASDANNPPRPLREYLVDVLRAAGEDVQ